MASNISVMGIYPDRTTVSDAVSVLQKAGYRPIDISVLSSDNQGSKDFGHEQRTRALEGAAIGAATGALAVALLAWFVSIQTVTTASFGVLVTAGPVLSALAGAGAGGILGWILGLLAGTRVTQYVAKRYAGRVRNGGILMSVHCESPEWRERAMKALENTGARNISCAKEATADYGTTDKPTERAPSPLTDRLIASQPVVVADRVIVPDSQPMEHVAVETRK